MQRAVDWIKKIKSAVNAVGKKQAGQLLFVQKHISCDSWPFIFTLKSRSLMQDYLFFCETSRRCLTALSKWHMTLFSFDFCVLTLFFMYSACPDQSVPEK